MAWAMRNDVTRWSDVIKATVATPAFLTLWILSSWLLLHPVRGQVSGECSVISERCSFPFTHEGLETHTCVELANDFNQSDSLQYCKTGVDGEDRWAWGICDNGCLKEDGSSREFSGELSGLEALCKTRIVPCIFPFVYNGEEYSSCTDVDLDVFWCATQVDQVTQEMVDHMWAKCSQKTCANAQSQGLNGPRRAVVIISPDSNPSGIEAEISFEQTSPESVVVIKGTVTGLAPGMHGFHIHQRGDLDDNCKAAGPHFNPMVTRHGDLTKDAGSAHAGDFGNVFAADDGVANVEITVRSGGASIFDDEKVSILQRALVIHEGQDDLGEGPADSDTFSTGNAGSRLACGIVELQPQSDNRMSMIIIIVVLAVVIIGLIILIACLICRCMKKKRSFGNKRNGPVDGFPDNAFSNGNPKRVPLYDELSIPFIDASPAPSPKLGRSTDR